MTKNKIVNDLKTAKIARRKELARLSFPEKIVILLRLQEMFNGINKAKGKRPIAVWKI